MLRASIASNHTKFVLDFVLNLFFLTHSRTYDIAYPNMHRNRLERSTSFYLSSRRISRTATFFLNQSKNLRSALRNYLIIKVLLSETSSRMLRVPRFQKDVPSAQPTGIKSSITNFFVVHFTCNDHSAYGMRRSRSRNAKNALQHWLCAVSEAPC
jgi:hypothetical protein